MTRANQQVLAIMGAKRVGACLKDHSAAAPSTPPGFASLKSLTLKRVHDDVKSSPSPDPGKTQTNMESNIFSSERFKNSLRHKPWVNFRQFDDSSEEESYPEQLKQDGPSTCSLPKGVRRGCARCNDCQKVLAKWHPEDARRPVLDEAPVFYPTEEEFEDTHKYISSIRPMAEGYGICRIVPPPSWIPPCLLKEKGIWENSKFPTRIQPMDKLQNREPMRKIPRTSGTTRKRRKRMKMQTQYKNDNENILEKDKHESYSNTERFGFEPGPDFTLKLFQKYADDFKDQYFHTKKMNIDIGSRPWHPSVEDIEGEYWRIVERPTEEIEILYGADLENRIFGSGFPKRTPTPVNSDSGDQYVKSGWNLKNSPRSPGSVLSFESGDISGVLVPWFYVGMCFSSFCWHVEDHHFYSLNYMHCGAPKIWYGVPGTDAIRLEGAMKKHLAGLFVEQPDLLHNLVTQFSPSILKSEGVPVYRCIQKSGEFIITFPRAYHSGFSCGFNCAEAVNFAPVDWFPHGQNAVELYREQGRKVTISHDKILLCAARAAVRAQWDILFFQINTQDNLRWKDAGGVDGILTKSLKARIEMERVRREYLCSSSHSRKMDSDFDSNLDRECVVCHYDLHFSAAGCSCSPDKFACLVHSKWLCSCPLKKRFFLFRYEINEMNVLLDAVGGKMSAVHKWGLSDLGLHVSSCVSKEKNEESGKPSGRKNHENRAVSRGIKPFSKVRKNPENMALGTSEITCLDISSRQCQTNQGTMLASKESCHSDHSLSDDVENQGAQPIKEEKDSGTCLSDFSSNQPSEEANVVTKISQSVLGSRDVIVINDDDNEGDYMVSDYIKDESIGETSEAFSKLGSVGDKTISCNSPPDQVLCTIETIASAISDKGINSQFDMESSGILSKFVPAKDIIQGTSNMKSSVDISVVKLASREADDSNIGNTNCHLQTSQLSGYRKLNGESEDMGIESGFEINPTDRGKSITESSSYPSNDIDSYNCLRTGPHKAKEVVHKIKCNVEPLEYGVVLSGKLWSSSQAIFPRGYRSRVRYFSILDPTQMCSYISRILDAGLLGPVFMVQVEHRPSEVFFHVSATRCWGLVRERLNNEIKRHNSLDEGDLPLQPSGPIDGLEMFGLSSPNIIQTVEAMDPDHVCSEYWTAKSRDPRISLPTAEAVLRMMFEKANMEELLALQRVLRRDTEDISPHVDAETE